jgi:hypothetical protein
MWLKPSNDQRRPGSQSARERKSRLHLLGETLSFRFSGLPFQDSGKGGLRRQLVNSEPGQRDWTPCVRSGNFDQIVMPQCQTERGRGWLACVWWIKDQK